jgi:hypothetical protein
MRRLAVVSFLAALVVSFGGCFPARDARDRSPVTAGATNLRMSSGEMRIRVRSQIRPVLGLLEEGVDGILADRPGAEIRRLALIVKIEATSTLLTALLREDPLLALADAWGYVMQLQDYAARPETLERHGEFAVAAGAIADRIDRHLFAFANGIQEDLPADEFERTLREWAAENPIEGSVRRRPSMDEAVADVLAIPGKRGTFAAIENLEETTEELMVRLDLYTTYLPRLARWEVELTLVDLAGDVDTTEVVADVEQIGEAADRIAGAAEVLAGVVGDHPGGILETLRSERRAATDDLRSGREAVLAAVRAERVATLAEVEAIVTRLAERAAPSVREAMRTESERLVDSVEEMRARLIDDAGGVLSDVVDHAFVRALQLLLIAAALLAIGVVLHARFLRSGRDSA